MYVHEPDPTNPIIIIIMYVQKCLVVVVGCVHTFLMYKIEQCMSDLLQNQTGV